LTSGSTIQYWLSMNGERQDTCLLLPLVEKSSEMLETLTAGDTDSSNFPRTLHDKPLECLGIMMEWKQTKEVNDSLGITSFHLSWWNGTTREKMQSSAGYFPSADVTINLCHSCYLRQYDCELSPSAESCYNKAVVCVLKAFRVTNKQRDDSTWTGLWGGWDLSLIDLICGSITVAKNWV